MQNTFIKDYFDLNSFVRDWALYNAILMTVGDEYASDEIVNSIDSKEKEKLLGFISDKKYYELYIYLKKYMSKEKVAFFNESDIKDNRDDMSEVISVNKKDVANTTATNNTPNAGENWKGHFWKYYFKKWKVRKQ